MDLPGHLDAVERARLFDAFEGAATRVGLAVFVVHVDTAPPLVIYASKLLAELVGRPLTELVGQPPWELVAPDHRIRVRDIIASRGPGAQPLQVETEIERADGTRIGIEVGVARIATAGAELALCYFRNISSERAALAALRRSEARFRSLVEKAPDGVVILQQGRIVLANPVAVRMFGSDDFESVRGRLLADFLPAADAARAAERIGELYRGAQFSSSEYRIIPNNLVVEVHSTLFEYDDKPAILTYVRDVTDRRRMQDQLFHNDRLAALGTLAATVAHEINNPLTYLQLNIQRLEREAASESDPTRAAFLREHLTNALHGVERIARIVRDLRVHAHHTTSDDADVPVDVVEVAERALQMVAHDLRHRAQLVRAYSSESAIIDGVAARLEQVILNLLVNAIQSLDEANPAENQITLAIDAIGDEVTIAVIDTGRGLSMTDSGRVFDPFFTTKPIGEGTGLGLAVCKQIVERMHGRIEVVTTHDACGTKIAVVLPRGRAGITPPVPAPIEKTHTALRILVVDDEPLVRNAIRELLSEQHEIETAGDGESALALVASTDFDVILCDVMMPRMNGRDVYERIRARWPGRERRVVFVTGGAFVPSLATFLESVDNLKLRKPFTGEHALALLQEAASLSR